MSILIKGMKMPENCEDCEFCYDYVECMAASHIIKLNFETRPKECPLIEVPTPHGRLIDVNEIPKYKYTTIPIGKVYADGKKKTENETLAFQFGWNNAIDVIVALVPQIIEAEGEKECG